MNTNFAMIKTSSGITLMIDGETYTVSSDHPNFNKIKDAIKAQEYDTLPDLIDIGASIEKQTSGKVKVVNGGIQYNGAPFHNVICDRIIKLLAEGFDVSNMLVFIENMMENPSHRAVNQLYSFLEACSLPITEDGHFLAYKKVRADFKDIHSGTFDNSPGRYVAIARNQVDEDPERTCSHGLHICSLSYLEHFGSSGNDVVVIVKINPRDVVAVPADYNNAKMRVAAYEVVGTYKGDHKKEAFKSSVVDRDNRNESAPDVEWHPNLTDRTADRVREVFSELICRHVDDSDKIVDGLEFEDADFEDLLLALEDEFDIEIDDSELDLAGEGRTVLDVIKYVKEELREQMGL
jgi:acyl carrier protein